MRVRRVRLGFMPNCSSLGNVLNVLVWTQATAAAVWVASEWWEARRRRADGGGGETRRVDSPPAVVQLGDAPPVPTGPTEAHLQVTRSCALPCPSCHVDPHAEGAHVPVEVLEQRLRALADEGVLHVALGGGEPTRHPELPRVVAAARAAGLSVGLTTAGAGADPARLDGLDQLNVSLDGLGEGYRQARGYAGDAAALATIRAASGRGLRVGVNIVLDRDAFASLEATVDAAVAAGARDVQLLRLKPVGRARDTYLERRLDPAQATRIWEVVQGLIARHPGVDFRADCALVPFLAAAGVDPARMEQFGVLGCHGGDWLVSVGLDGERSPCSFVPGPVDPAWRAGVPAEPCASCAWAASCRGGCHAVAGFLTGAPLAPDPECPIVAG